MIQKIVYLLLHFLGMLVCGVGVVMGLTEVWIGGEGLPQGISTLILSVLGFIVFLEFYQGELNGTVEEKEEENVS